MFVLKKNQQNIINKTYYIITPLVVAGLVLVIALTPVINT